MKLSQSVSMRLSFRVRGGKGFGGFVLHLVGAALLLFAVAATLHSLNHPYAEGFLCEGVDGVVLNRTKPHRKSGGDYTLDGIKVSRDTYESCSLVELPHN